MSTISIREGRGVIELRDWLAYAASCMSAWFITAMGGWHVGIGTILSFIIVDYVTAYAASRVKQKEWDWKKSITGMVYKGAYFVIIYFAAKVELLFACPDVGMDMHGKIRLAFILLLNAHEIFSILRNIKDMGISVPAWLKKTITCIATGEPGGKKE